MGRKGSGVEVRGNSIRIKFNWQGQTFKPTLSINGQVLKPNPTNRAYAERLAIKLKRTLELDPESFVFADFFPDVPEAMAIANPKSLVEVCKSWLASKSKLTPSTLSQYKNALMNVWVPMFGADTLITRIPHQTIAEKIGKAEWAGNKLLNNYLIPLRGVFKFEYSGKRAMDNPMIDILNARVVKGKPDPFSKDERDRILAHMREHYDKRVYAYFLFAFYTGMRPQEIIALRWSDVMWAKEKIHVRRVRTFKGSERDGTKTFLNRIVNLVDEAMEALQIMFRYTHGQLKEDGTEADIFQNPVTERHWHDERSQRDHYWKPTLVALRIRYRTPYKTRHTSISVSLTHRVSALYVAKQHGHSVKMMLDVYTDFIDEDGEDFERKKQQEAQSSARKSPEGPQDDEAGAKSLIPKGASGRRDWTRTNFRTSKDKS